MKILITGVAGFIGMHAARRLLDMNYEVIGIDNLNNYYDQSLKLDRLNFLNLANNFQFIKGDILEIPFISNIFYSNKFHAVLHFAAQASVRYSIDNPHTYIQNNITGFLNILEECKNHEICHLVYASSSSVYGANTQTPFSEMDQTDHPLNIYGASKKANELMAYTYSHLYSLPVTGLRFFTVYGPWCRPDQAPHLFLNAALSDQPLKLFNNGEMVRDFTYIDDVVDAVVKALRKPPSGQVDANLKGSSPQGSAAPYKIFNIGSNNPIPLMHFLETIEGELGFEIKKEFYPMQSGDIKTTHANILEFNRWVGYSPTTTISEGVRKYIKWHREYYKQ